MSSLNRAGSPQSIRSDANALKEGVGHVKLWLNKIEAAKRDQKRCKWMDAAKRAIAAFEGDDLDDKPVKGANLFYANVETIVPSVFNSAPIPDIRVRFDEHDKAAKAACDTLERVTLYDIDESYLETMMADAVTKAVVTGMGVVRVRYDVDKTDDGDPTNPRVEADTVVWDRIILGPARTWERLPWVAFEHDMPIQDLERLNPEVVSVLGGTTMDRYRRDLASDEHQPDEEPNGILETLKVYEIWDKARKLVWWVTPDDEKAPIAINGDPLKLKQFFPIARPFVIRGTIDSLYPQVHYDKHKALYEEFDSLSKRINKLIQQAKVVGLYDSKAAPDFERLRDCVDGEYIPAEATEQFVNGGQKRDLAGTVLHWPLEQIVATINLLSQHRESVKALIWEATGIADIMRGQGKSSATATQEQLKADFGTLRLRTAQQSAERLASDVICLMVELRANLTPWDDLKAISGMRFEPTPEMMQQAMQMVQSQMQAPMGPIDPSTGQPTPPDPQVMQQFEAKAQQQAEQQAMMLAQQFEQEVARMVQHPFRSLVIDVETDSTIRADVSRDMEQFTGLIGVTAQFANAIQLLAPVLPKTVEPFFTVFASQVRKFRLGRKAEDALDRLTEMAKEPPQQPGPSPQEMQMQQQQAEQQAAMQEQQQQARMAAEQAKQQRDAEKSQRDDEREQRRAEREQSIADRQAQDDQRNAEIASYRDQMKQQAASQRHEMQMQQQAMQHSHEQQMSELKAMQEQMKAQIMREKANRDDELARAKADYNERITKDRVEDAGFDAR